MRKVSHSDANWIQWLVENLYTSVIEKWDITTKFNDFYSELIKSSYGVSWPLTKKGL